MWRGKMRNMQREKERQGGKKTRAEMERPNKDLAKTKGNVKEKDGKI